MGRAKVPPLNSKRLTDAYLQAIATMMELPTKRSIADTKQMIEGKLSNDGRESMNVQVLLIQEDQDGTELVSLMDVSGDFVGPGPVHYPSKDASSGSGAEAYRETEEHELGCRCKRCIKSEGSAGRSEVAQQTARG